MLTKEIDINSSDEERLRKSFDADNEAIKNIFNSQKNNIRDLKSLENFDINFSDDEKQEINNVNEKILIYGE